MSLVTQQGQQRSIISPEQRQLMNERKRIKSYISSYERNPQNWSKGMLDQLEMLTAQYQIPFKREVPSAGAIRKTAISNLPSSGGGGSSAADDITTGDAAVTIATSTGNITLDSPADIILDAGGDDWKFYEDGNAVFEIKHESHGVDFLLNTTDEDWRFKGSDGGSTITALHLDISEAGAATFNGKITADAGIDIDNFNIDGTTIALSSGDITVDSAGRIDLSADDNGEVRLFDGSSMYAQFKDCLLYTSDAADE